MQGNGGGAGYEQFEQFVEPFATTSVAALLSARRNQYTFVKWHFPSTTALQACFDAVTQDVGATRHISIAQMGQPVDGFTCYVLCVVKEDAAQLTFTHTYAIGGIIDSVCKLKSSPATLKTSMLQGLQAFHDSAGPFMAVVTILDTTNGYGISRDYLMSVVRPLTKHEFRDLEFLISQKSVTTSMITNRDLYMKLCIQSF